MLLVWRHPPPSPGISPGNLHDRSLSLAGSSVVFQNNSTASNAPDICPVVWQRDGAFGRFKLNVGFWPTPSSLHACSLVNIPVSDQRAWLLRNAQFIGLLGKSKVSSLIARLCKEAFLNDTIPHQNAGVCTKRLVAEQNGGLQDQAWQSAISI